MIIQNYKLSNYILFANQNRKWRKFNILDFVFCAHCNRKLLFVFGNIRKKTFYYMFWNIRSEWMRHVHRANSPKKFTWFWKCMHYMCFQSIQIHIRQVRIPIVIDCIFIIYKYTCVNHTRASLDRLSDHFCSVSTTHTRLCYADFRDIGAVLLWFSACFACNVHYTHRVFAIHSQGVWVRSLALLSQTWPRKAGNRFWWSKKTPPVRWAWDC